MVVKYALICAMEIKKKFRWLEQIGLELVIQGTDVSECIAESNPSKKRGKVQMLSMLKLVLI